MPDASREKERTNLNPLCHESEHFVIFLMQYGAAKRNQCMAFIEISWRLDDFSRVPIDVFHKNHDFEA